MHQMIAGSRIMDGSQRWTFGLVEMDSVPQIFKGFFRAGIVLVTHLLKLSNITMESCDRNAWGTGCIKGEEIISISKQMSLRLRSGRF